MNPLEGGNAESATSANPPSLSADPYDYTTKYNTALSPEEEAQFQAWGRQQAARTGGRNPATDTYDYDMRGFWKAGASLADNGHGSDAYKKPNHPTFSTLSQYNGADGAQGGVWTAGKNGQPWTFTPSTTNLQIHGPEGLQQYFDGPAEGGESKLILPGKA